MVTLIITLFIVTDLKKPQGLYSELCWYEDVVTHSVGFIRSQSILKAKIGTGMVTVERRRFYLFLSFYQKKQSCHLCTTSMIQRCSPKHSRCGATFHRLQIRMYNH